MDGKQLIGYRTIQWRELRKEIFSRDGYKCTHCGRQLKDRDLQVHHMTYLDGKEAWDYPKELLTTYCKRCHAEEHGKIMPSSGWEYIDYEDLGDLIGECEKCHASIRYEHYIYHPKWGELTVGAQCADNLTNTDEASRIERERKSYARRMKNFIKSKRWEYVVTQSGYILYRIKQNGYKILIKDYGEYSTITISFYQPPLWGYLLEGKWIDAQSENQYKTLTEARIKVSEFVESGKLNRYKNDTFLPRYLLEGKWIDMQSKKRYITLTDAKIKVFELVESGKLDQYINDTFLPRYFEKELLKALQMR